MAIKIRCQDCSKKISIDEAFAGGMCRCPYCKALVYVAEESSGGPSAGARPSAPMSRPPSPVNRPAAPGMAETPGESAEEAAEHVPMARPVKIQGIITIVLLVLLLAMVGGGLTIALLYLPGGHRGDVPDEGPPPVSPIAKVVGGPGVAGISVQPPVMYLLDAGSSMRVMFDGARVITIRSVESLGSGKFNVMLSGEDGDKMLGPEYVEGGAKGVDALETFFGSTVPVGASDLSRSLQAALDKKPKTIVLITRKMLNDSDLAAKAKAQGVVIDTICLDGDPEVMQSMKKFAEAAGGTAKTFFPGDFAPN